MDIENFSDHPLFGAVECNRLHLFGIKFMSRKLLQVNQMVQISDAK